MADYSYSPDTLNVGTIGGNGFWLMMDSMGVFAGDDPGNTNDQTERLMTDDVDLIKSPPYFLEDTKISVIPSGVHAMNIDGITGLEGVRYYYETSAIQVYETVPDRTVKAKRVPRGGPVTVGLKTVQPEHSALSHLDYVQYYNMNSFPCSGCERIQVGNPGYTDVLPGLYQITIVPETIDEDTFTCTVTVNLYDGAFNYWDFSDDYLKKSTDCSYTGLKSHYLNTDGVAVSYAANNWNINIIPGLKIQIGPELEDGDKFVVAIGAEYINGRSITDPVQTNIYQGCDSFFLPFSDQALVPRAWNNPYSGTFIDYGQNALFWSTSSNVGFATLATRRWSVFNVSGEILDGVEFHIWPFVRLAQTKIMRPFSQWFMGCNFQTQLPEDSENAYVLTMTNVGTIGGIKRGDFNCSYPIDVTVKEVEPSTFEVLGTRTDGKNLLCDGTTLYLWEAGGVYFVLSADTTEGDIGRVHIRKGTTHIGLRNTTYWNAHSPVGETIPAPDPLSAAWHFGPTDYPIGAWSAVEGPAGNFLDLDVVDKGDGTVGLPAATHNRVTGELIRIKNSTNYAGDSLVLAASTNSEIVITATYVEETLSGATYQSLYPADECVPETYFNGVMAPQGHEYVLVCPNLGTRTKWYDHYWSMTWVGCHTMDVDGMMDNPFECALVITCSDPKYFKAVPLRWNFNPDITGQWLDAGVLENQNCARRGLRSIQQVGEAGDALILKSMLNVADIDRSLVIRLNQIPANLARVYERLGVSDGSATTTTTIAVTTTTVALTTTTTEAVTTTTSV